MLYLKSYPDDELGKILTDEFTDLISLREDGASLQILPANSFYCRRRGDLIEIGYTKRVEIFRGLSYALQHTNTRNWQTTQKPCFRTLGAMLNTAQCTYNFSYFKKIVRTLALFGYDNIQLYLEENFEVKREPYFGHMKGRYTASELKKMVAYASLFGITIVPAIETLAHLYNLFLWQEYIVVQDVDDVLLTDCERTAKLIENIFETLADIFPCKKVNIGFDEAMFVGGGKHADLYGFEPRHEIVLRHLKKVLSIAEHYGFTCMLWSDMIVPFDERKSLPKNADLPKNCTLIYWDYYKTEEKDYIRMFERHTELGFTPVFAGGAWNWIGFAPANRFGFGRSQPALHACLTYGIQDVLLTDWGGTDSTFFTALPAFALYAEFCYTQSTDDLANRCKACSGAVWEDLFLFDQLNPPVGGYQDVTNPCKYLFHNDPLAGTLNHHCAPEQKAAYRSAALQLHKAKKRNRSYIREFDMAEKLADFMEIKCCLGAELKHAYLNKDVEALRIAAEKTLPQCSARLHTFARAYRQHWNYANKPFGFLMPQRELGGLAVRLHETQKRLKEYINGKTDRIEELEQNDLPFERGSEISTFIHINSRTYGGFRRL